LYQPLIYHAVKESNWAKKRNKTITTHNNILIFKRELVSNLKLKKKCNKCLSFNFKRIFLMMIGVSRVFSFLMTDLNATVYNYYLFLFLAKFVTKKIALAYKAI